MQKLTADAFVHADRARNVVDVAANLIAQVRDLVDERNLRREKGVGGVLRELSSFERSYDKRRFDQVEGTIEVLHDRDRLFIAAANHDAIRAHEIVDCSTFPKKLRIRNHA